MEFHPFTNDMAAPGFKIPRDDLAWGDGVQCGVDNLAKDES